MQQRLLADRDSPIAYGKNGYSPIAARLKLQKRLPADRDSPIATRRKLQKRLPADRDSPIATRRKLQKLRLAARLRGVIREA
jgi:hypothetical protein